MAKQPNPATTKTRLHKVLDPSIATELYECFLRDTIELVTSLAEVEPVLAIHPEGSETYFRELAPGVELIVQKGHTLGERLDHVIGRCLVEDYEAVCAINSDSPNLPVEELDRAFDLLDDPRIDVVLGPADDGGYYLIGVREPPGELATGVTMSTSTVFDDTLAVAEALERRVATLRPWYDVDEPLDLDRLRHDLASSTNTANGGTHRTAAHTRALFDRLHSTVAAVIPALDEEANVADVVRRTLAQPVIDVIVVDNGSIDATSKVAREAGAVVIDEPRRGYGYACAAGAAEARRRGAGIIVFLDADLSSPPEELPAVIAPLLDDSADLVMGSRVLGSIDPGAMAPHQRFGNALSAWMMRRLYRLHVTDLGPFRAVRSDLLASLDMAEMTFGWPTEMTVKAARANARIAEVPVSWLNRNAGRSKVSGTVKGSILAARHILGVTIRYSVTSSSPSR